MNIIKNVLAVMRNKEKNNMTYNEHFNELRFRVIISLLLIIACFFAIFSFSKLIINFLTKPLYALGYKLYFYKVQEAFLTTLKSSFIASLILTSPIYISLLCGFVVPALSKKQKLFLILIILFIYLFFILGFYFSYKVMIPFTLNFFFSFGKNDFSSILSVEFYLDFFLTAFFFTGIGFQTPLIMLLLSQIGIIDSKILTKTRKHAVIIILILSAILTPPDVVSQIILSVPLYILYELGVLLVVISNKLKKKSIREKV